MQGKLGRLITQKVAESMREVEVRKQAVPGLVVLHIIVKYYSSNRVVEASYQAEDLRNGKVRNGNLEEFQNSFSWVRSNMRKVPSEESLRYTYYEAIKSQPALREDICHYMRVGEDHVDHSFQFLWDAVDRQVQLSRQNQIREGLSRGLSATAAAATKKKAKRNLNP